MNIGLVLIACGTVCSATMLARRIFPRLAPEAYLLELGLWSECDGEPMNKWAEEFDRRDAATSKGQP